MTAIGSWQDALPLLAALLLGGALFAWFVRREAKTRKLQQEAWAEEQQKRDKARCKAIEEGLRGWLVALGLPQLEEETRLTEAARQLRIVLVERLMNGPRVR
ncbi:MAG: hypothetical protein Q8K74_12745 [Candidatus Nitrotoga sp.]|nr:hypothetical protein [Candidatus Nitrotoga sp.]MDO9447738.1 hypothetical protein [Candidatus Nitrotoga sp.]MDP1638360.1 hypothetical protein [Candidatus Nitrotoga sp.]MDP1856882.1 hypothetical protein [Candidatus Nitrotoga sp.]MDP3498000.1 hypothetical protein [Candidatus Nitrotoga sp.]